MAAPAVTARVIPAGIKLHDGYRCVKAFAADPDVSLFETETQPPGADAGDAIDNTTMWNNDYRTMRSRQLVTLTECTVKFAYDPAVHTQFMALLGVETSITDHFPDGSTLSYYGFLRKVEFDPLKEGEMPTGTATVQPTNWDPTGKVEAGPVLVSVAGT